MTQEVFKQQIEHFVNRYKNKMESASYTEQAKYREDISLIKATIARKTFEGSRNENVGE